MKLSKELWDKLVKYGQEHLAVGFDELSDEEAKSFEKELSEIDFELMAGLYENADSSLGNAAKLELTPLKATVAKALSAEKYDEYYRAGAEVISKNQLAAVTVAGGQGSRLGHDGPKGTYDIGLPTHKSLFEIQSDGLKKIALECGGNIPWYIMTSYINHEDTVAFFEKNDYFGYGKENVFFFRQNMIPVMNMQGKLLKSSRTEILRSPDGNGGIFSALGTSGAIEDMESRGVKYVFICGIDNCLVKMADPLFVGFTVLSKVPATAKSFLKRTPGEKAGILCYKNGKPGVVEYTEVPKDCAEMVDEKGEYVFGDTHVLNYVFDIDVLKKISGEGLCYHTACKKITYMDNDGNMITSKAPDAYKFEMFLFDAFDLIDDIGVLRIEREEEFAPVKNKEGEDSPALARELFMKQNKIHMTTPIVEMDGDEMTRIVWEKIKEILIEPFIDLKSEYYDLGIQNRDATDDQVTVDAANATKKYGVAVKCATITPNAARVEEFGLKKMWKSPNGTIRSILDGTVFRAPILVDGIRPLVRGWDKPIIIARHAYGDIYSAVETKVPQGAVAELTVKKPDGESESICIHEFKNSDGIIMGMHNEDNSIAGFARACFEYALTVKMDLWFSAKDTISKKYDHHFKDIFQEIYDNEYKEKFEKAGITYFYTLVDDAISRVMRSSGGFVWACKNYDGDVFSDMLASAFGSLSMMTSVLVSPYGYYEYEAAHGTIPRHYHKYLKGEKTSTNPIATVFAWTGALAKRGELDGNVELTAFAKRVEEAVLEAVSDGFMTGDLAKITEKENVTTMGLEEFLTEVKRRI